MLRSQSSLNPLGALRCLCAGAWLCRASESQQPTVKFVGSTTMATHSDTKKKSSQPAGSLISHHTSMHLMTSQLDDN